MLKNVISELASALTELERIDKEYPGPAERALVSGLELPGIIRDVIDLLMPALKPFEATIYFYLLRHSIVENGTQLIRVSRRSLQAGIVTSAYAGRTDRPQQKETGTSAASYETVRAALTSLETIGAISQQAEPNRDGTLYEVRLPEQIELCIRARQERIISKHNRPSDLDSQVDFYNVKENRTKIYDRDDYRCRYCKKQLTRFTITLDHVRPVSEGGDNSEANLVVACLDCNSRKNRKDLGSFLADQG